jgi:putative AlgH/UPF0301 family transcriptional regulator
MNRISRITLSLYRSMLRTCRQYDSSPQLKAHLVNPQFVGNTLEKWLTPSRNQILSQIYHADGIYYKPRVSFVQALKNEFRANLNTLSNTTTEIQTEEEKLKYDKLVDSKIDDLFAVFKLLNDNLSAASKSGCQLNNYNQDDDEDTPIEIVTEQGIIKPGTILVSHPMLRDRMERKVILITQVTKKGFYGVVLNGKPIPLSTQKKLMNRSNKKQRLMKDLMSGRQSSDQPVIFDIRPDGSAEDSEDYVIRVGIPISEDMLDKIPQQLQGNIEVFTEDDVFPSGDLFEENDGSPITLRQFQRIFESTCGAKLNQDPFIVYELPKHLRDTPLTVDHTLTASDIGTEIVDSIFIVGKKHMPDLNILADSLEAAPDRDEFKDDIAYFRVFNNGYVWTRGTLIEELKRNHWFTIDPSHLSKVQDLIFEEEEKEIEAEFTDVNNIDYTTNDTTTEEQSTPSEPTPAIEESKSTIKEEIEEQKPKDYFSDEFRNKVWNSFLERMGGEYTSLVEFPSKVHPHDFEPNPQL